MYVCTATAAPFVILHRLSTINLGSDQISPLFLSAPPPTRSLSSCQGLKCLLFFLSFPSPNLTRSHSQRGKPKLTPPSPHVPAQNGLRSVPLTSTAHASLTSSSPPPPPPHSSSTLPYSNGAVPTTTVAFLGIADSSLCAFTALQGPHPLLCSTTRPATDPRCATQCGDIVRVSRESHHYKTRIVRPARTKILRCLARPPFSRTIIRR